MIALWISLAVAVIVLLAWRLRRAARKLDRILTEERALSEREAACAELVNGQARYRDR